MILSDLSVRRPVFATVLSLLLVILGLAALVNLPVIGDIHNAYLEGKGLD